MCDGCRKKLEQKFQEVKQYLDENPNASVNQVSEDNDVSVKQIKQWIREERLSLSEASLDGVTCEHCGRPIRTGRFCEKCKAAMANSFANSIEKPKPLEPQKKERDGNKMRFLYELCRGGDPPQAVNPVEQDSFFSFEKEGHCDIMKNKNA